MKFIPIEGFDKGEYYPKDFRPAAIHQLDIDAGPKGKFKLSYAITIDGPNIKKAWFYPVGNDFAKQTAIELDRQRYFK